MNTKAAQDAEHFLNDEKQFHLGVLPTEQSNPKTQGLDKTFARNTTEGVAALLAVDSDVVKMARRILSGNEYEKMVASGIETILSGGRIVFSGCGATGRLSILLESMWRHFFIDLKALHPALFDKVAEYEDSVFSIMTGGDFALIRSVESFEDYASFGTKQAEELAITAKDMLVAITEGGETSSVLGTVAYAADQSAKVFLMFNNPADILCKHIERSRRAIEDPRVTVLDLYCGPMAIAGSTRMQATTSEQLIAGAALEHILFSILKKVCSTQKLAELNFYEPDYIADFASLVETLLNKTNIETIADMIEFEADIYKHNGLITYYADAFLLDIFTDTSERAPTFMLPPFRKNDDKLSPVSWAFVKTPELPTAEAWQKVLGRSPRCLDWSSDTYKHLNGADKWIATPPKLGKNEIIKFVIGNEIDKSRTSRNPNVSMLVVSGSESTSKHFASLYNDFGEESKAYTYAKKLVVGNSELPAEFKIEYAPPSSPLKLMERLAMKLVMNTVSTGTMVLLGRVAGNWMSWVEVSNKKLRDRGIRLISELCNLSYRDACYALHETLNDSAYTTGASKVPESPVQRTIRRLQEREHCQK